MRACATGCHAGMKRENRGLICAQCRADLELGRMVRGIPEGYALIRTEEGWAYRNDPNGSNSDIHGKTTEEALKGVGK